MTKVPRSEKYATSVALSLSMYPDGICDSNVRLARSPDASNITGPIASVDVMTVMISWGAPTSARSMRREDAAARVANAIRKEFWRAMDEHVGSFLAIE